jgi:hypothetical protein
MDVCTDALGNSINVDEGDRIPVSAISRNVRAAGSSVGQGGVFGPLVLMSNLKREPDPQDSPEDVLGQARDAAAAH